MNYPDTMVTFLFVKRCIIESRLLNKLFACSAEQSSVIFSDSLSNKPHEYPIEIAVYFLSPVSIHTLMLDFFKF